MARRTIRLCGAAVLLALATGVSLAKDAAALTAGNFVDVGDAVADMLSTSGLAFSTMVIGAVATPRAAPRHAVFRPPSSPVFAEAFESPCPGGGSVKGSVSDTDTSGDLSTSDRFVTRFESCVIEGGVVSGRSEFVVANHRFEGSVEITELDFRFTQLGTSELRWSGAARVVLRTDLQRGTERYQVSYRDLAVQHAGRSTRWNFSLELVRPPIGEQVASLGGAMTLGELALQLRQDEPYVIDGSGYPRSGQLTAQDRRGARLQVEAGRSRYTYRLYQPGNRGEVPDSRSQSLPYGRR